MTLVRRLGALLGVGLTLAACTSSAKSPQVPQSSAGPVSKPAPTVSVPSSVAPVSSVASVPPSSPASSSSPAAVHTSVAPKSTCTNISVRVLPGGASPGQEIAAVQYTNAGSVRCLLVGYPTVTLLLNGRLVGIPSLPSTPGVASSRRLAPGDVAESLVHDYTQTCQAPLSDTIRVTVPGSTQTYLRPGLQLRACVLRVDKLGEPE